MEPGLSRLQVTNNRLLGKPVDGITESERAVYKHMRAKAKRWLLIGAGTLSTGLGIVGVFVPILPTTPFLLLAAACYARSSDRFYQWLMNNRIFGAYVKNYIEGRGMPVRIKISTIALLWLTIGLTITFAVQTVAIRIVLVCIAIGVTVHIVLIKARKVGDTQK